MRVDIPIHLPGNCQRKAPGAFSFSYPSALDEQDITTLVIRSKTDSLPGFKTPKKITAVETLLATYRGSSGDQQQSTKEKELARLDRDELLRTTPHTHVSPRLSL